MNNFSRFAISKSKGRFFKESRDKYRSPFQRDRDRILHSASFRRLKHKTQVFVNTEGDHYRTRITHSLEVAQIGRTIARYFNLNEDLVETLCLAHDLGHTPFGHAGENALDDCMANHGGFDHNLQTLRIVMILENKYLKFRGLNLCIETLDGLLKHNGPITDLHELSKLNRIINMEHFIKKNGQRMIIYENKGSLESQIASISDDIAYNNHDVIDGFNAKLFNLNDLIEINFFKKIYKRIIKKNKNLNKNIMLYSMIRESINLMVTDIIKNTSKNLKKNKIKSIQDIYLYEPYFYTNNRFINNYDMVSFSYEYNKILYETSSFLRKKMYNNKKVLNKNNKGKKIIKKLFDRIITNPSKYINKKELRLNKYRTIADYISGMTDRYAISLYNDIK